jgi:hypothetical protein
MLNADCLRLIWIFVSLEQLVWGFTPYTNAMDLERRFIDKNSVPVFCLVNSLLARALVWG